MCGRFAFFQSPAEARRQLRELGDPVDEIWGEENVRQSYNFAPGYTGLVYRAATTTAGAGSHGENEQSNGTTNALMSGATSAGGHSQETSPKDIAKNDRPKYVLQAMKWGLVPFWTKRKPQYGSLMRTINCRNDSLIEDKGMWTSMKRRKRCIVLCNGFYEWLKKNNGKERIPHYIKRKDGRMMCLAGLWDCAKYEGKEEELYTFTIITTDSNQQLKFLHDRMPVILEQNSQTMQTWLNPSKIYWNKDLQSMLKPYNGDLDVYPVMKEVGKVGNDSPNYIIPLDSSENKSNIANFFPSPKKRIKTEDAGENTSLNGENLKKEKSAKSNALSSRTTAPSTSTEHNAPMPMNCAKSDNFEGVIRGIKREHEDENQSDRLVKPPRKEWSIESEDLFDDLKAGVSFDKYFSDSPRRLKSTVQRTGAKHNDHKHNNEAPGNTKITSFFGQV